MASNGVSTVHETVPSTSNAGDSSSSAGGISFSITKRSQQGPAGVSGFKGKRENRAGNGQHDDASDKDLVFSLEGGTIHSSKPVTEKKEYVVPLIRNVVWRRVDDGGGEKKGGTQDAATADAKSETDLSLDKEAAEAILSDLKNCKARSEAGEEGPVIPLLLQNKPPVDENETGELADLHMRPEPSTEEEYEEMPIGEFGKAMLRGMGWSQGMAIGKTNKGMVAPVEFIPRMGKLGLGAAPKPKPMPDKKRPRKPGDTADKAVRGPYVGADGRMKHTRLIGEEIPEQPIEGFRAGNYAKVLRGPHVGLCGKIVSADEDNCRVSLRLAVNGQVLDFSQHHLELISKEHYVKPPAIQSSSQEYGLIKKKEESDRSMHSPSRDLCSDQPCSSKSLLHSNADFREASDRERSERRKKRKYAHSPTDTNYERTKRNKHGREAQSEPHSTKSSSTHSTEGSSHHKKSLGERLWVAPHLRVRIVDTKFKGGKYYNSKVEILDVVSGDQCICQTAEGIHLEGVHQSMLETVVPKTVNAAVMIVGGKKHKGQIGRLLSRDSKKCMATVEVVYSSKVLAVDYDNICEYTGDVED